MARTKTETIDPATGKPLPEGVVCRGKKQYRARKLVEGKRVSRTFESAKDAKLWLGSVETDVGRGVFLDQSPLEQMTVAQMINKFETAAMKDGGQRRGAREDRGHSSVLKADEIAALRLSKLTPAQVRRFRDRQLDSGLKPATVVKRLNLLAAIINHARSEWDLLFKENPAAASSVKRPAYADVKRDRILGAATEVHRQVADALGLAIPQTEEDLLLNGFAHLGGVCDAGLIRWGLLTAMRLGESLALQWGDLDLERSTVRVYGRARRGTKAQRSGEKPGQDIRPLIPQAVAFVSDLRPTGARDSDRVFPIAGTSNAFSMRFNRICQQLNIDDLRYHDLRHCATVRLAEIFNNPMDLKRVTGHRDLKSLDRYYNITAEDLARKAQDHLSANPPIALRP